MCSKHFVWWLLGQRIVVLSGYWVSFYLNTNLLLYENYFKSKYYIDQNENKKSYCKVWLCAEKGSGLLCALVMHFKTAWWKVLIRAELPLQPKRSYSKIKKERKGIQFARQAEGLNEFWFWHLFCGCVCVVVEPRIHKQECQFQKIGNLLHGKFCQLLA